MISFDSDKKEIVIDYENKSFTMKNVSYFKEKNLVIDNKVFFDIFKNNEICFYKDCLDLKDYLFDLIKDDDYMYWYFEDEPFLKICNYNTTTTSYKFINFEIDINFSQLNIHKKHQNI